METKERLREQWDEMHGRRWIPVSERLPDRYTRVLAFVDCQPHEHPHAIGFIGSLGVWSLDELHEPLAEITHWMPLPEPPAT